MKDLNEMLESNGKKISKNIETNSQLLESGLPFDNTCEICGGLGWISLDVLPGDPMFGKLVPCPHRNNEIDRSKVKRISNDLGLLRHMTLENFRPEGHAGSEEERNSLLKATEGVRRFISDPRGWLLIQGTYGSGKTHLAAAIANACLDKGIPAKFVNVPDLLDYLRAAYSPSAEETYDVRFSEVRDAPLLILDDLGTQNATQWAEEKLYQILNARYVSKSPTVITTNLDLKDLDPRLRSRLSDLDLVRGLQIIAPDFRRNPVQQEEDSLNQLRLHHDKTFATFNLRSTESSKEERDNLRQAVEMAKNFATDPRDWLIFTGGYGCGKTHLAAAIANEVGRKHQVMFVPVPDLLDHLRAAFSPDSRSPLSQRFEQVRTCPLLILDDLGTESTTPWAREKLYQIINYRYVGRLPTVITTSLLLNQIDPRIRVRILDESRCTVFPIIISNYRGGPGIQEPRQERTTTNKYTRRSS
jgi:DNA replication protein DnaC